MDTVSRATRAYVTLDGLRGVAALSIVVLHAHRYIGDMTWSSAALAVDMFFVLSGFVMAHAYGAKLQSGMSPWEFVKLRVIRFYPLYLLGIALGVIEAIATIKFGFGSIEWTWDKLWSTLPFALFMLPTLGQDALYPLNGVMWSIGFELLVNIVWVMFWRPLQSMRVLLTVIVLSAIGLSASVIYWDTLVGLGTSWRTFIGGCFRVSYSFFLGVLFYRLHRGLGLPKIPGVALLIALPAVFFLPLSPIVELGVALFILPWFVLLGSTAEVRSPIVGTACIVLGAASYALYVVHNRLYRLTYGGFLYLGIDLEPYAPWVGVGFVLALVALSLWLEYRFHQPIRDWMVGRLRRNVPTGPATAP